MQQSGILNRVNNKVINWQYVESIDEMGDEIHIYYHSGRIQVINHEDEVNALRKLINVFPNIADDLTRNEIIQRMQSIKTDIPQSGVPEQGRRNRSFRTDIVEK